MLLMTSSSSPELNRDLSNSHFPPQSGCVLSVRTRAEQSPLVLSGMPCSMPSIPECAAPLTNHWWFLFLPCRAMASSASYLNSRALLWSIVECSCGGGDVCLSCQDSAATLSVILCGKSTFLSPNFKPSLVTSKFHLSLGRLRADTLWIGKWCLASGFSSCLHLRVLQPGQDPEWNPQGWGSRSIWDTSLWCSQCSCETHWFPWQVAGKRWEGRWKSDFEQKKTPNKCIPGPKSPTVQWHNWISPVVITSVSKEETRWRIAGSWCKPEIFSCLMLPVAGAYNSAMLHTPREVTPVSHFLLSLVTINH